MKTRVADGQDSEPLDPDSLPGPFYAVRLRKAFGWLSSDSFIDGRSVFHGTATRWTFNASAVQVAATAPTPHSETPTTPRR
jgi:hypothetical protein